MGAMGLKKYALIAMASIVVLLAVFVYARYIYQEVRREKAHRQLRDFAIALRTTAILGNGVPGPKYEDAVSAVTSYPEFYARFSDPHYQEMLLGRDPWGNRLVFTTAPDGRGAVLRSTGANGRDDGGEADDIEYVVELP